MSPLGRSVTVLAVLTVLAGGCKKILGTSSSEPTEEDKKRSALIAAEDEKRVASAESRLKFIESLAGKLPSTPAGRRARVSLGADWNRILWINEANLADPMGDPKGVSLDDAKATSKCATEARRPPFKTRQWSVLERCENARYLFVVRTTNRKEPYITEYASAEKEGEFHPGQASGDVLVYDITEKTHLGTFPWTAASSDRVKKVDLASDFDRNIASAVNMAYIDSVTHP